MSDPQAVFIEKFGGPEVLRLRSVPCLDPREGEIRVAVKAAGVNFADLMMRMGLYPEAPKPPFVPGYEIAGTVLKVGSGVVNVKPGDRVVAGMQFGGYVTEVVINAQTARLIPPRISEIEAAAIPVNFLTAAIALEDMARVRVGDRVLVQNAAGGVGVAALQLACLAGAEVTGLVGSEAKKKTVLELGGPGARAFTYAEFAENRDRFDVILDPAGGETLKRNIARLSPTGRIVNFGVATMVSGSRRSIPRTVAALLKTPILTPFRLMMSNTGVFGLNLLKIFQQDPELASRALDRMLAHVAAGRLRPIVGKTFPLAQAGEAQEYLRSRANIGKVVLTN